MAMRRGIGFLVLAAGLALSSPAQAQLGGPVKNGDSTITVTGARERPASRKEKEELSDWRMAETPHVVVFSKDRESDLVETARNLEALHFLLSAITGRVDEPDETIKVAVTMIGDAGDFDRLRLSDLRWQYGPYPPEFENTVYYDPRSDGSVIATTKTDVNLILKHSVGRPTRRDCPDGERTLQGGIVMTPVGEFGEVDPNQILSQMPVNELAFCQTAQSRLYSAFAQNFLMTYYPAAYPRWFLQGFGEMFATMESGEDFVEYGHAPAGFHQVLQHFGGYPVSRVLDGRYMTDQRPEWTPHHAWRMVHLLYFNEEWKPRLRAYLDAIAAGEDEESAAALLGERSELQEAVHLYRRNKLQYERMDFPAGLVTEPAVRRLTRAEAGIVQGRLEMGARVEVPAVGAKGRDAALSRRADWLERLRDNAARFPELPENHLLLAEAECRVGNPERCLASADRLLEGGKTDLRALVLKGTALAQMAATSPEAGREERLREARRHIVQANRLDPDNILPLLAWHDSFAMAGEPAPDIAVEGLFKVVESVPAAPVPRLKLGEELVERELDEEARKRLLPVAKGAFDTPEQPEARALLAQAD